jgi:tetratricopeptide (TPR) repeat protein
MQLRRDHSPNTLRVAEALELRTQGRVAEALELLDGVEFSPDLYNLRGDLQFDLGQIQDAVTSYSTVLAFNSIHPYARFRLALALRRLERWDAAVDALRALLEEDSHRDDARILLGECLLHGNRAEEALACFDRCWSESALPRALFGKAVALQLLGRLEESESAYVRLVTVDSSASEAWSNLIALSAARRDLAAVHRHALRLLELDPRSAIALRGLLLVSLERAELSQAAHYHSRLHSAQATSSDTNAGLSYRMSAEAAARFEQIRMERAG